MLVPPSENKSVQFMDSIIEASALAAGYDPEYRVQVVDLDFGPHWEGKTRTRYFLAYEGYVLCNDGTFRK